MAGKVFFTFPAELSAKTLVAQGGDFVWVKNPLTAEDVEAARELPKKVFTPLGKAAVKFDGDLVQPEKWRFSRGRNVTPEEREYFGYLCCKTHKYCPRLRVACKAADLKAGEDIRFWVEIPWSCGECNQLLAAPEQLAAEETVDPEQLAAEETVASEPLAPPEQRMEIHEVEVLRIEQTLAQKILGEFEAKSVSEIKSVVDAMYDFSDDAEIEDVLDDSLKIISGFQQKLVEGLKAKYAHEIEMAKIAAQGKENVPNSQMRNENLTDTKKAEETPEPKRKRRNTVAVDYKKMNKGTY